MHRAVTTIAARKATPMFATTFLILLPALTVLLPPPCMADDGGGQSASFPGPPCAPLHGRCQCPLLRGATRRRRVVEVREALFADANDCNLVLHGAGRTLWASDAAGSGISCYLSMQHDGNLVMYTSDAHNIIWQSNTQREQGNYALVLQRGRNLVIYGPLLWATGTRVLASTGVVVTQKSTSAVGKPKNKSISIHGE